MKISHIILSLMLLGTMPALAVVKVGTTAPDFTLPGDDNKKHRLSDHRGKYVVLEWFNDDCPYVDKHYHEKKRNMQDLQQVWRKQAKEEGRELVWYAIVSSAPGKQGHVTAEKASSIRNKERQAHMQAILMDESGEVGRKYAAKTTPHMYIIDPNGKLRYQGAIDDKPSARLASLEGAKNHIHTSLNQLFAGKAVSSPETKPYGCSVKY